MKEIKKVLFVCNSGTARGPMAMAIFLATPRKRQYIAEARGIVVQFPEPLNQKAEAVLISNGNELKEYSTKKLLDSEITEDTLIVTFEESHRNKIISEYSAANEENTILLNEFVGDELEVVDPYGGPIQTYGLCYEVLKVSIEKLMRKLEEAYDKLS